MAQKLEAKIAMVILLSILICTIPIVAVLYPLLRRAGSRADSWIDESSLTLELERRWEAAMEGLQSAEFERAIGNLDDDDFQWLREVHVTEAILVLKAVDMSGHDERLIMDEVDYGLSRIRRRAIGIPEEKSSSTDAESPNPSS